MKNKTKKISSTREKMHKGVDNILDKAESLEDKSKEDLTRLKEKSTTINKNVNKYLQKNPKKSILIATGVGMAAGAILAATFRKKSK